MSEGIVYIKECPCFRSFEGEQLCINGSEIRRMITIDVSTDLLESQHVSEDFINSRTEYDDLCFCLAYLGDDGRYYCMSQQHNIMVLGQKVSKEEMERALEILAPENVLFSSVLCGECLYSIIAALKEDEPATYST
jgi:hypothetical protein